MVETIKKFWMSGSVDHVVNRTLLVLIPKKTGANTVKDFRPISLHTTLYKILTRLMVLRIWSHLNSLICLTQTSFNQKERM